MFLKNKSTDTTFESIMVKILDLRQHIVRLREVLREQYPDRQDLLDAILVEMDIKPPSWKKLTSHPSSAAMRVSCSDCWISDH